MRPSQVISALTHLVQRKRPVFIWGPPGVGKSDGVHTVANNLSIELRDVRLNLMDPVDLKGFPSVEEVGTGKNKMRHMAFIPPDFLPRDPKSKGILFLDEMNSAPPSVQAAAYQLILNRKIGEYELPEGWAVIAAGNRAGDRALVNAMPSALANRFVHIDFDVDVDDWYNWATQSGVSDITRAFIKFRPALLHSFNPSTNERAFPTPRSWVFVDDVVGSKLDASTEYELIKGTVGEGAAAEYLAFSKLAAELPSAEEILMNPDTAPVPTSPAAQYAVCTMLDTKATPNSFGRLLTYIERLPVEFQVLFVRSAAMANRAVTQTKEYVTWVTKNQKVLL
jgi:hypothetical protein